MGQNGRLVAKYAGSSKLSKRISLIISGMNFGDMLDIAKWLCMKSPPHDSHYMHIPTENRLNRFCIGAVALTLYVAHLGTEIGKE